MYLLDTHIIVWLAREPHKLDERIKALLLQKSACIYFSAVSLWEIAIKNALGKKDFNIDVELLYQQLIENQYLELPVLSKHCYPIKNLPLHHKDPFDRMLIAQAISENLTLITEDHYILQYPHVKIFKNS